jgi:uncharacterized protein (DUF2164 family)
MSQYKINTDQAFFSKFDWLSNRVRGLGGYFQNEGLTAEHNEVEEWSKKCEETIVKLIELKQEGLARFEKI